MESKEVHDGGVEILDVFGLLFIATDFRGDFGFGVLRRLAGGLHRGLSRPDLFRVGPNALRKFPSAFAFLHRPGRARRFDAAGHPGIAGR